MAKKLEELISWQKARYLTQKIYEVTHRDPVVHDYGFCSQLQRAAVSIMSNIAEGFGYSNDKQFNRFLSIARASGMEVTSLLYVALDANYFDSNKFQELYALTNEVISLISGLQKYLKLSSKAPQAH